MKAITAFCFIITWLAIIYASVVIMAKYDRLNIRQDRLIQILQMDEGAVIVHSKRVGR